MKGNIFIQRPVMAMSIAIMIVFVVDKDGIAHGQIVSVLPQTNGKEYIVTGGLDGTESIVSEGAGMVKEGQKVIGNS